MPETVPFNRFALDRTIADIHRYLAELECIDRTLAYIAERHHVPHAGPGPAYHYLDVSLGSTYPFTRRMGKPGVPFDEAQVQQDLRGIAAAAQGWASGNIQSLKDVIHPIVHPSVSSYDQMINSLQAAHKLVRGRVLQDFGALSNNLGDWKGQAAENFADEFYGRFANVRENQQTTLDSLLAAVAVMGATVQFSQHSVMNAVTSGRQALLEQLEHRSQGAAALSAKDFVTIASIGTSVLSLMFGQVPLAAVSLSVASLGLTVGGTALPDNTPVEQIAGTSAEELFTSLFDALRDIAGFAGQEYDLLHGELTRVAAEVGELRQNGLLSPPRPRLADGVDGPNFHHLSSTQYR